MKDYRNDELVVEYIRKELTPERERELESILAGRGFDIPELHELKAVYAGLGELPVPEAGESMTARFYAMLENEKRKETERAAGRPGPGGRLLRGGFDIWWPRLAYAAVLVVIGWSVGYWAAPARRYEERVRLMSSEMTEMKRMMMFSMLNRSRASERLQAVQYFNDLAPGDDQVVTAMLDVFEHDENVNVRLAALDVLAGVISDDRVRAGLIGNVTRQDSPIIQLALVDILVSARQVQAVEPLRRLLERKDLNMVVRSRIDRGIRLLS